MNIIKTNFWIILIVAVLPVMIASCDKQISPEDSWQQAVKQDTAKAYSEFLQQFPNHPNAPAAKRALRETVLIPYLGYVGSDVDRPSTEQLKVPASVMSSPANTIFENPALSATSSFSTISINGHSIELARPFFKGDEIETVRFGNLRCVLAQTGLGAKSQTMIFYLGGIRSQRDKIIAQVK